MPSPAASSTVDFPARTRQRLQTRDRLLETALDVFRRDGVAEAQIEDIVRKARVARGTFYLHFPTKDHVLLEWVRRKQDDFATRLRAHRQDSPARFLRRVVDLMLADARSETPGLWRELAAVVMRRGNEMRNEAPAMIAVLSDYFTEAQKRGRIRRDTTPFELTAVFLPAVYGVLQMKLEAPRTELQRALYRAVDIFVRGTAP